MKAIRMLVGQEGPAISRVRGQVLAVGTDVDSDEAGRLVNATFAEEVTDAAPPSTSSTAPAKPKAPAKKASA